MSPSAILQTPTERHSFWKMFCMLFIYCISGGTLLLLQIAHHKGYIKARVESQSFFVELSGVPLFPLPFRDCYFTLELKPEPAQHCRCPGPPLVRRLAPSPLPFLASRIPRPSLPPPRPFLLFVCRCGKPLLSFQVWAWLVGSGTFKHQSRVGATSAPPPPYTVDRK
jgi:hypothetical protein